MKRRFIILLALSFIFGSLLSVVTALVVPGQALADEINGKWINQNTIRVTGSLSESKVIGTYKRLESAERAVVFIRQGDNQNCLNGGTRADLRDFGQKGQTAKIYFYKSGPGGLTCGAGQPTYIVTLENHDVAKALFSEDDEEASASGAECDARGGFAWLFCGIMEWIVDTVESIEKKIIEPFLKVDPLLFRQENNPTYAVWQQVRNLANIFFVLAFFFIIFANTLSFNIDAYTIKKMLPRLVAAAVLVQISYFLAAFAIDFFNVLGAGVGDLLLQPLKALDLPQIGNSDFTTLASFAGLGLALGSIILISGEVFLIAIGALLVILGVFITLVFRQVLITLLIIMGPMAFAMWILPNTEGFFKLWYRSFLKALLMYPLIMILFAAGKIFAAATLVGSSGGLASGEFRVWISIVANIIPLALIPATFKFAGGAMTTAAGVVMGKGSQWGRGLRSGRVGQGIREARKERALVRYGNPTAGSLRKGMAALQAGVLPISATSRRRLSGEARKMLQKQMEEGEAQIRNANGGAGLDRSQLQDLAAGGDVQGIAANPATRTAAIKRLAEMQQWGKLAELQSTVRYASPRIWQEGLQGTDVFKKAPSLMLSPPEIAYEKMTGEKLEGMDHTEVGRYLSWVSQAKTDQKYKDRASGAIRALLNNSNLRGRLDNDAAQHIYNTAHTGILDPDTSALTDAWIESTGSVRTAEDAQSRFESYLRSTGRGGATPPPTPPSGTPPPPTPPPGPAI